MTTIPLGTNDLESKSQDFLRLKIRNMYVIQNSVSVDGYSRVSRPTLTKVNNVGSGPIYSLWRDEGALGSLIFVVSGEELYTLSEITGQATLIGSLPGSDLPSFAGSRDRILVVRNGTAYLCDGSTLTPVVMPDDRMVSSCSYIDGYFLLSIVGEELWYWIDMDETAPDALSFASAERYPDDLKAIAVSMDEIWMLGATNEEVWQTSTTDDITFDRIAGRAYSNGILNKDTVVTMNKDGIPCLLWVSATNTVVMAQGVPSKVSNESIEELLRDATNVRCWGFSYNRHSFYVVTSDSFTMAYDLQDGTWSRWDSYGYEYWRAHTGIQIQSLIYAGDYVSNAIYMLEDGVEDDGDPIVREIQGEVMNSGKEYTCNNVSVKVNSGWSPTYGFEPKLEMRWSDDQRATWSTWLQASLGDKGYYSTDVVYRSLGLMVRPGRTFEFRFAAKARFRIDYATMNEI